MDLIKVGVVGLGNMGLGMAATIARKGFSVSGYDVNEARRTAAEAQGVTFCADLKRLLSDAPAIILSLPFARDVEAVLTVPGGLLDLRHRKVVVIDTSTSDPGTSRRMAARLAEVGHSFLDAPVSGGPSGAAEGTLTMMVGGSDEAAAVGPLCARRARRPIRRREHRETRQQSAGRCTSHHDRGGHPAIRGRRSLG